MRATVRVLAVFLAVMLVLGNGAPLAGAANEMCPAGGALVMAEIDRDKTLAWAKARTKVEINDNGTMDWSVLTFSAADEGIGLLVEPGHVFFGVAGRGGETYPRDIERAFGKDFEKLKGAVGRTLTDMVAAGVVKIEAAEIQGIAAVAGLGVVAKGANGWALTARDCQAVDLPTSGL